MKSQKNSAPSARIWIILVCFWRFLERKRLFFRSERQNFRACGANSCSWSDLKSLDNKHKVKSDRTAHTKTWRVSSMWTGSVFVKKRRRRENFQGCTLPKDVFTVQKRCLWAFWSSFSFEKQAKRRKKGRFWVKPPLVFRSPKTRGGLIGRGGLTQGTSLIRGFLKDCGYY